MMKKIFTSYVLVLFSAMIVLATVSCKKECKRPAPPTPEMEYFDLNNTEVKETVPPFNIDVDHDNRADVAFGTLLVGDPVTHSNKLQFWVLSSKGVNLPVNGNKDIPVMSNGDLIALGDFNGYHWTEFTSSLLIQKTLPLAGPVVWEGLWMNALHKYVPFQVTRNNDRYNGWVEISVDIPAEKIILHKAAVSIVANKIVTAGK